MRIDLDIVERLIQPNNRVLDLGCGDGTLLRNLKQNKNVQGYGVEIDGDRITRCITNGIDVIELNMDKHLSRFDSNSFDTVIMSQALQAVHYPHLALDEMLRIGRECIISFPNFGHWRSRLYLNLHGKMPVSKFLPYTWYDTPNIHLCTIADFEQLCANKNITILSREYTSRNKLNNSLQNIWPNTFAETAIYQLTKARPTH